MHKERCWRAAMRGPTRTTPWWRRRRHKTQAVPHIRRAGIFWGIAAQMHKERCWRAAMRGPTRTTPWWRRRRHETQAVPHIRRAVHIWGIAAQMHKERCWRAAMRGPTRVEDDAVILGLEPLHGIVLDKSVGESN